MDAQEKILKATSALPHAEPRAIRLKPSTSDYVTFVRTTSKVLGTTGPAAEKTEPNMLVLSLANMAAKAKPGKTEGSSAE